MRASRDAGAARRAQALARLASERFDLLVIGGGIVGSRIAYEAASSGLSVALIDARDFAGATSSASSKLLHGGLRYLATGDVRLVRRLAAERAATGRLIAPPLVEPLPLVLAVPRGRAARSAKLAVALGLYAAVCGRDRASPRILRPRRAAALIPGLEIGSLASCGLVTEARTHDARLTLATVRAAERAGAVVANYVRADELAWSRRGSVRASVTDTATGAMSGVSAAAVVNSAGPWVEAVRRLEDPRRTPLTRLSKGTHVICRLPEGWRAALALFDETRSAFAVPWEGMLLLGATDTAFDGDPRTVAPTEDDVRTVLGWFGDVLPPDVLAGDRVAAAFAGLRVLPRGGGSTARERRRHVVTIGPRGMVSVAGGKLTTHRVIARDALAHLPPHVRPHRATGALAAVVERAPPETAAAVHAACDAETARHLLRLYGAEAASLLAYLDDAEFAFERVDTRGPDVWAQVAHAFAAEAAVTVDDVLARRTTLLVRGLGGDATAATVRERLSGRPAVAGVRG